MRYLLLIMLILMATLASAETTWKPITNGYLEEYYCMKEGNCAYANLTLDNLYVHYYMNASVINVTEIIGVNETIAEYADDFYLRLDATNDPVTGNTEFSSGITIGGNDNTYVNSDWWNDGYYTQLGDNSIIFFGDRLDAYVYWAESDSGNWEFGGDVPHFLDDVIIEGSGILYLGETTDGGIIGYDTTNHRLLVSAVLSSGGTVRVQGGDYSSLSVGDGADNSGNTLVYGTDGQAAGSFGSPNDGGDGNYTFISGGIGGAPHGAGSYGNNASVIIGRRGNEGYCSVSNYNDLCVTGVLGVAKGLNATGNVNIHNFTRIIDSGTPQSRQDSNEVLSLQKRDSSSIWGTLQTSSGDVWIGVEGGASGMFQILNYAGDELGFGDSRVLTINQNSQNAQFENDVYTKGDATIDGVIDAGSDIEMNIGSNLYLDANGGSDMSIYTDTDDVFIETENRVVLSNPTGVMALAIGSGVTTVSYVRYDSTDNSNTMHTIYAANYNQSFFTNAAAGKNPYIIQAGNDNDGNDRMHIGWIVDNDYWFKLQDMNGRGVSQNQRAVDGFKVEMDMNVTGNLWVDGNVNVTGCICYDGGATCLGTCV